MRLGLPLGRELDDASIWGRFGEGACDRWETGRPMAANGITVLTLSASILVAGFECLLAVPYIAEPTGPAGDRVVVVERNVLLAGYGDVYLVSGGFGVGRKIASYSADDGYSPMDNGTYALEWRGSEPHFTAYGTPANPVVMHPAD